MEIHPDAPANPLYHDLKQLIEIEKQMPIDYRRHGKLRNIQVAQHNQKIFKESLLETQNICLPTLNQLRTPENMSQLQERVYQKLLPHVDALNICINRSRTTEQADYCFTKYSENFNNQFKPTLKQILLDY